MPLGETCRRPLCLQVVENCHRFPDGGGTTRVKRVCCVDPAPGKAACGSGALTRHLPCRLGLGPSGLPNPPPRLQPAPQRRAPGLPQAAVLSQRSKGKGSLPFHERVFLSKCILFPKSATPCFHVLISVWSGDGWSSWQLCFP